MQLSKIMLAANNWLQVNISRHMYNVTSVVNKTLMFRNIIMHMLITRSKIPDKMALSLIGIGLSSHDVLLNVNQGRPLHLHACTQTVFLRAKSVSRLWILSSYWAFSSGFNLLQPTVSPSMLPFPLATLIFKLLSMLFPQDFQFSVHFELTMYFYMLYILS